MTTDELVAIWARFGNGPVHPEEDRRLLESVDGLAESLSGIGSGVTPPENKAALLHGDYAAQFGRFDRIELRPEIPHA